MLVDDGDPPRSVDDFAAFDLLAGLFDLGEHIVVRDRGFDEHFLLFERDVVGGDACRERDGTARGRGDAERVSGVASWLNVSISKAGFEPG